MFNTITQQGLRGSLILRAILVLLVLGISLRAAGCRPRAPEIIPIAFMVAVGDSEAEPDAPEPAPAEPEPGPPPRPEPEPEPSPAPEPAPPPPPPPRPPRPTVRRSTTRVVRQPEQPTAPPNLTPEEIQRLLDQGAQPGTRTTVPDEDQRAMIQVRNALHAAWRQPTAADSGTRPVIVEVALSAAGGVGAPRIVQSSGSQAMDDSVLQAVNAVSHIPGLPAGFLRRYPRLRVEFRLQP